MENPVPIMDVHPIITPYDRVHMIVNAARLADKAHYGQLRKYHVGVSYINHPGRVAMRLCLTAEATPEMVAAGWLHDVIEDTDTTAEMIRWECGPDVENLVVWLTNPSKGMTASRATRKLIDREHIAKAPVEAKIIKLVDRADNLKDMMNAPLGFMELYIGESKDLFEVLKGSHPALEAEYTVALRALEDTYRLFKSSRTPACSAPSEQPSPTTTPTP